MPEERRAPYSCTEAVRLERMEEHIATTAEDVRVIREALVGTLVTPGCRARQHEIEQQHGALVEQIERLTVAIMGNGTPGINERLRLLEAVRARNERLSWLLIGAVIVQAVMIARESIFGG